MIQNVQDSVEALVLDLLEWISVRPRPYLEVIEIWRTSCPRLPVWEEANGRGYIAHSHSLGDVARVELTEQGRAHLEACRPRR